MRVKNHHRAMKIKVVLFTPDNGNGVVTMNIDDDKDSLSALFSDRSKFRTLTDDSTNTRLSYYCLHDYQVPD